MSITAPPPAEANLAEPILGPANSPVTAASVTPPPAQTPRRRRPPARVLLNGAVVTGLTIFVLMQLQPAHLLAQTTATGGDMGAHVWLPAYLRDHLLRHGLVTGWSPDWFGGFPALVFYFPLPSLLVVAFGAALPYTVAFKIVTAAGTVTLPVAAYALGRSAGMDDPGPACLAAASLPFLFERSFTIYGGNMASTMAGEFSYSLGLTLAVLFLAVVARGLDTGRRRALAATLLAATVLSHVVPALFALAGAAVLVALSRPTRAKLAWAAAVVGAGGALAAFWALPFVARLGYTSQVGWPKITDYRATLLPGSLHGALALAAVGTVVAVVRPARRRAGRFLAGLALLSAAAFALAPAGRLWNARLLPCWFLCVWLLAGVGAAELVAAVARRSSAVASAGTVAVAAGSIVLVGIPLRSLPFGHLTASGAYDWLGIESRDRSFVPDWVRWNYTGYEDPAKPGRDEYFGLVSAMAEVGKQDGCGRAMWEFESEEDRYGSYLGLSLLPYWTHGCIGSMEGLYLESSTTTPFHFVTQAELSAHPERAIRNISYPPLDVAAGVRHLQQLGVRYYLALSPAARAQAATDPDLRLVASSGPWAVSYADGPQQRTWQIYEVAGSEEVVGLATTPVVLAGPTAPDWDASALAWYERPGSGPAGAVLARSGPATWPRVGGTAADPPLVPVADPATVTGIRTTDDGVSFDVDRPGAPVLVKTPYFPNWRASGATGPFQVSPNEMVVVPTSRHVVLRYAQTPVDRAGQLLSVSGAGAVALFWWADKKRWHVPLPGSGKEKVSTAP